VDARRPIVSAQPRRGTAIPVQASTAVLRRAGIRRATPRAHARPGAPDVLDSQRTQEGCRRRATMRAMKATFRPLVILCSLFPVSAAAGEEPPTAPPVRIEVVKPYDRGFLEQVNRAIRAGVDWLRRTQDPDGSWSSRNGRAYPLGTVALGAHALLKGNVSSEDDSIRRAFLRLRGQPMTRTYDAAAVLMALEARYVPTKEPSGSRAGPPAGYNGVPSSIHADAAPSFRPRRATFFAVSSPMGSGRTTPPPAPPISPTPNMPSWDCTPRPVAATRCPSAHGCVR
jgi:hypothetical protein